MALYGRAMSYFRPDAARVAVLVVLIGISDCVGLLEAWPLAVLIDSVLTQNPRGDWIHQAFLSVLPDCKLGQVVGLGAAGGRGARWGPTCPGSAPGLSRSAASR